MFGSTNNTIKSQYNFETTSTTPFHHNGTIGTPSNNNTLNNLIGRKLIDTSLYSTDYSTTEDGSSSIFYTPHSNLGGHHHHHQQQEVLKKNSCPHNPPPISSTSKFAKAPFHVACSLKEQPNIPLQSQFNSNHGGGNNSLLRKAISQKYSPNVAANTVTFISSNMTASTEDLEDCFGSPTTPTSSSYHEVMTDSATPVSKLSTSTISKKSPHTDDYSSHQSTNKSCTTTTNSNNTLSSGRTKSSETLSSSSTKSFSKPKTCHSFKVDNPFLSEKNHLNDNYSSSFVREDNFMANHYNRSNTSHINNREKKAIFELSVNEEDLRILEEGIPYQNNTTWLNNTIQTQFSNKREESVQSVNPISNPFLSIPQRDQGNFTKSLIEIDGNKIYKNNIGKPVTIKDSPTTTTRSSIIDHHVDEYSTLDSKFGATSNVFDRCTNRLEKIYTDHCDPSHQIDTARYVPKNSTFEISLDGSRSCTSNSGQPDFKSCMLPEENVKFQPEKKHQASQGNHSTATLFSSSTITHTAGEPIENSPLLVDCDCTFLPSPILPKENSIKSNNTTFRIDHSLLFKDEEETKSIEKQALFKPDINNTESTENEMLKAVSIRNELNQLQFVRMPIGGTNIKPRQQPEQMVTLKKVVNTTPNKNIIKQEYNRPVSELACSFKANDGFFMMNHQNATSNPIMLQQDNMDIDDCEEFEKNKQRFKNKFIKRRAKLLLNSDQVNIITSRSLSENLKIITEKACVLQKLKLQLEEKTLSIQSVCDRIVHEDLSWQLEDIISESTPFWSTCDQVTSPASVLQFLNKVCESENEIINTIEDLIDFVITSAKRMCKKHSLNINIILDTIRESAAIELTSNRSYSQLKSSANKQYHHRSSTTKPSNINRISSNFSPISSISSTSEYSLYSSKSSKNVSIVDPTNTTSPAETLEQVFNTKKRSELFETIENNVDSVLDICSAIRNYASDEKMETLDTNFEEKFSAYCKILDEMKTYSAIDFDISLGVSEACSISFY